MVPYTQDDVLDLAGTKSYDRGLGYLDAVDHLETDGTDVYATVQGNDLYEVQLHLRRSGVRGSCDCPWGEEGNFCKHCVAVALVYLYELEHGGDIPQRLDLRPYLEAMDHNKLVDLLIEAANSSRNLRRHLEDSTATHPAIKRKSNEPYLR
jgi:uncharacterized Zn finger protein